jgi:hypothetical protein
LSELETQWIEELRAQEAAQLAQLEQSRRELPLQRRREGSVAVNEALAQLRSASQKEREAVAYAPFNVAEPRLQPGRGHTGNCNATRRLTVQCFSAKLLDGYSSRRSQRSAGKNDI